jgi:hypothetical protein
MKRPPGLRHSIADQIEGTFLGVTRSGRRVRHILLINYDPAYEASEDGHS